MRIVLTSFLLTVSEISGAAYLDQPVNPTMDDCRELENKYRDLVDQSISVLNETCGAASDAIIPAGCTEAADELDRVSDARREALRVCRADAERNRARVLAASRSMDELIQQYRTVKDLVEDPVGFFRHALRDEASRFIERNAFGVDHDGVNFEGREVFDYVVTAAKYGAETQISPLARNSTKS